MPYDPLSDRKVPKRDSLPAGWRFAAAPGSTAPRGWAWAHNGLDVFDPGFRYALVRKAGGDD